MTCAYSPPLWISYYRPVSAAATRRGAHRIALPRACRYTRQGTDHTCMAMPKILKAFTVVAATSLAVRPRIAWAHHFMGGGPPETFAQGLLSGLGHPVIGLDHAAFIVAAGFFLASVEGGMWGILALIAKPLRRRVAPHGIRSARGRNRCGPIGDLDRRPLDGASPNQAIVAR